MDDASCDMVRCDPRIVRSRAAVLAAAAALLTEDGLAGLTVEAVAARSGVAKTTIYRHWPSRAELVVDTFRSTGCGVTAPDTGSLRDDLVVLLEGLAHELAEAPWAAGLAGLSDAAQRDPELADVQRHLVRDSRRAFDAVLDAAVGRGELPADVDREHAAMLLGGPLFYRRLVTLAPMDAPGLVPSIVDAVLPGIIARAAACLTDA